jgi:hypothetical protein
MKRKLILFINILLLVNFAGWAQTVQMRVYNKDGTVHVYNIDEIRKLTFAGINGINDPKFNTVMKNFNLLKSYPNPFISSTTMTYVLEDSGPVRISIIDLNGKLIKSLPTEIKQAGEHTLFWDGTTASGERVKPGIYFCTVKFNNQLQTNKMVLNK